MSPETGRFAPAGAILGIRTADLDFKEALLAADPSVFFTTPHFDGYPAVLIVLGKVSTAELRDVLAESWLARAPKRAADAFLALKKPVRAALHREGTNICGSRPT